MTDGTEGKPNIYQRVIDTLIGKKPDRIPFIDRLELWYTSHCRAGTLPDEFDKPVFSSRKFVPATASSEEAETMTMSLTEVHRAVGIGQELMLPAYSRKLHGVELVVTLDDEPFYREKDPVLEDFPRLNDIIPMDKPSTSKAVFITPHGKLTTRDRLLPNMVASGTQPYMEEHILKESADYKAFEFILNNSELIPLYDSVREKQEEMGDIGFVVPMMSRSPFQQILINCVGEIPLFQMLHDSPGYVNKLLTFLDERYQEDIQSLAGLDWPYVEFDDNLDGTMTNPHLFKKYSLPLYQKYTDLLHAQGKKVGSHTDGNIQPLLGLLAESGLDVCESFTPIPVTNCTLADALEAWRNNGPIVWGGIPSPLLEERVGEEEFRQFIESTLKTLDGHPIILGIGDMVMGNNLIERVKYIVEHVEQFAYCR